MLSIKQLNLLEIQDVYNKYLVNDFPKEEQKPLSLIQDLIHKNAYVCYGLYEDETLVSYAFFGKDTSSSSILLDFLAVVDEYRSFGYGSKFLSLIKKELKGYDGIIFEVESGESAADEEAKAICERRIEFYHRNGVRSTTNYCFFFGVDMVIMFMPLMNDLEDDKIGETLDQIYHVMYTKDVYEKNIKLRKEK